MKVPESSRTVWQAASLGLEYPEGDLAARAGVVRRALEEAAPSSAPLFADLLDAWTGTAAADLQQEYVDLFDLSRRHALYLSYWTDGDTRRRGEVLHRFKQRYRASGFAVDLRGELPDFLPVVLEYAALADPAQGAELLQEYRASLELLRLALLERSRRYASVVLAVCRTLPGASPSDRQQVIQIARQGPPGEQVGLDPYIARREGPGSLRSRPPYDPRLLPVAGGS